MKRKKKCVDELNLSKTVFIFWIDGLYRKVNMFPPHSYYLYTMYCCIFFFK